MRWPSVSHGLTTTIAARRARVASARASPPSKETPSAVVARLRIRYAKAGCVLEVAADTSQHGLAPNRRPAASAVAFRGA